MAPADSLRLQEDGIHPRLLQKPGGKDPRHPPANHRRLRLYISRQRRIPGRYIFAPDGINHCPYLLLGKYGQGRGGRCGRGSVKISIFPKNPQKRLFFHPGLCIIKARHKKVQAGAGCSHHPAAPGGGKCQPRKCWRIFCLFSRPGKPK